MKSLEHKQCDQCGEIVPLSSQIIDIDRVRNWRLKYEMASELTGHFLISWRMLAGNDARWRGGARLGVPYVLV